MTLSLTGCSVEEASPSDGASPDHIITAPKSQGKYRFGITDTLTVEFSENIDTAALKVGFSDTAGLAYRFRGQRNLLLFGTRTTDGISHFPVNTPFTLSLTGLQDPAGNGRPAFEETFHPYPWADQDFLDTTFDSYDTLYSGSDWLDGTPVSEPLIVEGRLDYKQNFGRVDRLDYKVLRVAAPDTLDVLLTTPRNLDLRLQIAGPFNPKDFDAVLKTFDFDTTRSGEEGTRRLFTGQTGSQGRASHQFVADLKDHKRVLDDFDGVGLYVVRLKIPEEKEGFYRLEFRIRKFR